MASVEVIMPSWLRAQRIGSVCGSAESAGESARAGLATGSKDSHLIATASAV